MFCSPVKLILVIAGMMHSTLAQICYVPPSNECARLYEHQSCSGRYLTAGINQYNPWVGLGWNDQITSVVVRAGCILTIYEDAYGHGYGLRMGNPTISYWYDLSRQPIRGTTWNDFLSSYKCSC